MKGPLLLFSNPRIIHSSLFVICLSKFMEPNLFIAVNVPVPVQSLKIINVKRSWISWNPRDFVFLSQCVMGDVNVVIQIITVMCYLIKCINNKKKQNHKFISSTLCDVSVSFETASCRQDRGNPFLRTLKQKINASREVLSLVSDDAISNHTETLHNRKSHIIIIIFLMWVAD